MLVGKVRPRVSLEGPRTGRWAFPLLPGASGAEMWHFVFAETLMRVRELLQGSAVCSLDVLQARRSVLSSFLPFCPLTKLRHWL